MYRVGNKVIIDGIIADNNGRVFNNRVQINGLLVTFVSKGDKTKRIKVE